MTRVSRWIAEEVAAGVIDPVASPMRAVRDAYRGARDGATTAARGWRGLAPVRVAGELWHGIGDRRAAVSLLDDSADGAGVVGAALLVAVAAKG